MAQKIFLGSDDHSTSIAAPAACERAISELASPWITTENFCCLQSVGSAFVVAINGGCFIEIHGVLLDTILRYLSYLLLPGLSQKYLYQVTFLFLNLLLSNTSSRLFQQSE